MTFWIERLAAQWTERAPGGDNLCCVSGECPHLFGCAPKPRARSGGWVNIFRQQLLCDQHDQTVILVITQSHLPNAKVRIQRLLQIHVNIQYLVRFSNVFWVFLCELLKQLLHAHRQRGHLLFFAQQRHQLAALARLDVERPLARLTYRTRSDVRDWVLIKDLVWHSGCPFPGHLIFRAAWVA